MTKAILLTVLLAGLIVFSTSTSAFGAQLDARINPNNEVSTFKVTYQKTVFIEYEDGGKLFDELRNNEWTVSGTVDSSDSGVKNLAKKINEKLAADGSSAGVQNLDVLYDFHLKGRNLNTSIDYKVIIEGEIVNYVITKDQVRALVDMGWRGISVEGPTVVNDVEINLPISVIKDNEPILYDTIVGTEAETILSDNLIDANFILKQPLENWHFLFDPTGINVDAGTFGLSSEIQGFVVSSYTMGESSLREGRQVERVHEAIVQADETYVIRSVQSTDQGNIHVIGFGAMDSLDGVEILGVTPKSPEGFATTSTGEFPVMIVYGMAAMAAIGGGAFFMFSNRALKKEKQGQQGIAPDRLVGYQTSASAGGYQTNRGEAQLKDDSSYQQTRSVYDETPQQQSAPEPAPQQSSPPAASTTQEAACGCAASADMGSECDCEMQGSCLCDADCQCNASVCKEHSQSF